MFTILLLVVLSSVAISQVKISEQLSNPEVTCFAQDIRGRMWIGTSYGLNRYNGHDFHQYQDDMIPGNRIESLLCDSKGRIWVGTDNGVASFTDAEGFRTYEVKSEMRKVSQVIEDKEGRIFINLTEDLCVLDTVSMQFVPSVEFFDRYFQYHQKVYIGADSLMWVVGAAEIRCFDTSTMYNLDNQPTPVPALLSEMFPDGNIIFGGAGDLFVYRTATSECRRLGIRLPGEISMVARISDHEAVIKTTDGSVVTYDDRTGLTAPFESDFGHRFNLTTIYPDAKGNIWMGSSENGFMVKRAAEARFNSYEDLIKAFAGHPVVSMDEDSEDNVWAFTSEGIYRYDSKSGTASKVNYSGLHPSVDNDILQTNAPTLFVDSRDNVWFALPNQRKFYQGKWDGSSLKILKEYSSYYPHRFAESADGSIWCGLRNECILKVGDANMQQVYPWNNTETRDIIPFGDNVLVSAYNDHLAMVSTCDRSVSHLTINGSSEKSLSRNGIFNPSVMFWDGNRIWIGTRNSGMMVYEMDSRTMHKVEGMTSGRICAIENAPDGSLWVSTPEGLMNMKDSHVQSFSTEDGLTGSSFYEDSSCILSDGTILFGSPDGITSVNPKWTASEAKGVFSFEDMSFGKDMTMDITGLSGITLGNRANSFSISFVNIVTDSNDRQEYAFKLEGYDKDWIEAGSNTTAYYSNLDPGHYRFMVRVNGEDHGFSIRIKPHFLLSWWMTVVYAVLVCSLVFWIMRNRREMLESRHIARINEMNMKFFTNISHEFRTPLTMISGPAEQLSQDESLDKNQKELVNVMQGSINRMLTLVNQLLELGKIENDTLKLQVSEVDIIPLARMACEPFRRKFEQGGGTFNMVFGSTTAAAMTDEDKFLKVLTNLLSNAVKYTPADGVITMSVSLEHEEAVVSVSDNGPGIPADKLEKIFDRYYQLGRETKGKSSFSTGIGLYYARALAKVHHGSLIAANLQEGGVIFTYRYPSGIGSYDENEIKVDGNISSVPVETVPGLVTAALDETDSRSTVLVIDDDNDMLSYITSLLGAKYRVIGSGNADEALEIARKDAPDVILSDVMMPGKSGLELCREIKDDMVLSHIPVILVTAKGTVDSQVEGLEQGADAYVTKPFSPSYLLALVKSQIDKHRKIRQLINSSTGNESLDNSGLPAKDAAFMREIYTRMDSILSHEGVDIADLAEQMGVSRSKFYYKIKALTGKSPSDFFMQYRLNVAAKMLKEGTKNVSEIAYSVGFSTLPHFSKCFKKQFGVSPSKYA